VNTDAFGPYLEFVDCVLRPSAHPGHAPLLREVFGSSLAGANAQEMARRALGPVAPMLPLLRRLGARAGSALSSRAAAGR
jgi:hypothetical protein